MIVISNHGKLMYVDVLIKLLLCSNMQPEIFVMQMIVMHHYGKLIYVGMLIPFLLCSSMQVEKFRTVYDCDV